MIKKLCFLWLLLMGASLSYSQDIEWASKVIDVSSELSPKEFGSQQILGKPNVYPWGQDNPNAWTPKRPNKKEYIKVGFAKPMKVRQIAVAESYNPSALQQIYFYDKNGGEHLIIEREPTVINRPGRFIRLFTDLTDYEVYAVKLVFDGSLIPGYFSIDAVGISDSQDPINFKMQLAENVDTSIKPERLSENVNSPYEELKPLLSPDGKILFFGRKFHPGNTGGMSDYEDIWMSKWDSLANDWGKAENMGQPLNGTGPNWISSITPDGNSMVLLLGNEYDKEHQKLYSGVSVSMKRGDGWSYPTPLKIDDFYNSNEKANFYLANNRRVLLMSVEREDTHGGRDLYVSFLKRDSTWTAPKNLGNVLNTAGDEVSPFLATDDKTLFFSSDGFVGYGKSDIYMTKRLDDTWLHWSEPENLGPSVNGAGNDLFFNMPTTGNYAYYTKEDSVGNTDIYHIALPLFYETNPVVTVKGKIIDQKTGQPLLAKITYEDLETGKVVGQTESDPTTGEYQIVLPAGKKYGYVAEVEGYLPSSDNLDLTDVKSSVTKSHEFIMAPVEKQVTVVLNNIFFDFDRYALKPESKNELNRIKGVLQKYPDMRIKIIGHTDSIGTEEYNLMLSKKRAQAVVNYLAKDGISKDRMEWEGKGETTPAYPNDSREHRSKNRRVEFNVLKKD